MRHAHTRKRRINKRRDIVVPHSDHRGIPRDRQTALLDRSICTQGQRIRDRVKPVALPATFEKFFIAL